MLPPPRTQTRPCAPQAPPSLRMSLELSQARWRAGCTQPIGAKRLHASSASARLWATRARAGRATLTMPLGIANQASRSRPSDRQTVLEGQGCAKAQGCAPEPAAWARGVSDHACNSLHRNPEPAAGTDGQHVRTECTPGLTAPGAGAAQTYKTASLNTRFKIAHPAGHRAGRRDRTASGLRHRVLRGPQRSSQPAGRPLRAPDARTPAAAGSAGSAQT